jgi:D-lactate dehydrogenase
MALKKFAVKIGPDPASLSSARLGGILSNNASGMCCGVIQNAYHTLRSMTFLLPSGTQIDTAALDADTQFREREPRLAGGLLELKHQLEGNQHLADRIRSKYRMKNTTGYSLNAFLDYSAPVEIFSHLLIGAEGTLAFIAEAVLETVPDLPVKYTGLLLFPDFRAACAAIVPLRDAGAAALEVMDRASLRSVENKQGVPPEIRQVCWSNSKVQMQMQFKKMLPKRRPLSKVWSCCTRLNSRATRCDRSFCGISAKECFLRLARHGPVEPQSSLKTWSSPFRIWPTRLRT